jgi:hypothetical protein
MTFISSDRAKILSKKSVCKNSIFFHKLDSFTMFQDLYDEFSSDINECNFQSLYSKLCQDLR